MATTDSAVLQANAWCGTVSATGGFAKADAWALLGAIEPPAMLAGHSAPGVDRKDWRHEEVGWGVVLPDRAGLSFADLAAGVDAPEPIRRLLAQRPGSPVLRYRKDLQGGRVLRYDPVRGGVPLSARGNRGIGKDAVPRYLLIVGSPEQIPWRFQYRLQVDSFVGRLDLDDDALSRYVDALIAGWKGLARDVERPLIWSVDHGYPDITFLMRAAIADKMHQGFIKYQFKSTLLTGGQDELKALYEALHEQQPAFVLTTSHGATFPLNDTAQLKRNLGLLVDRNHALLDPSALLGQWSPNGAIWYAHACCSAGADSPSMFTQMADGESSLGRMLDAVAQAGPCTAPLPRALLGAPSPIGAFIGHVEPTFDWTLLEPEHGQRTTNSLILEPLFNALHSEKRTPVGMALDGYYDAVAGLLLDHIDAIKDVKDRSDVERARRAKLLAMDRLAMVLLGDPTVCLPD